MWYNKVKKRTLKNKQGTRSYPDKAVEPLEKPGWQGGRIQAKASRGGSGKKRKCLKNSHRPEGLCFSFAKIFRELIGERNPAKPERLKNPWAVPIRPGEERKRDLKEGRGAEQGETRNTHKATREVEKTGQR